MRPTRTLAVVAAIMVMAAGCASPDTGSGGTDGSESPSDTAAFNPDEADGMEFVAVRDELGPVPAVEGSIKLGAVAKAFENEYWRTLKEGMETGAAKAQAQGVDVTIDVKAAQGEGDEQGQLAIVEDMINKKYSALLLSPISDGNLVPAVEEANDKGIPVINVNDGIIAVAPNFIGPRAIQNGELAAEWISGKLGGEGEVAIVIGLPKAFA